MYQEHKLNFTNILKVWDNHLESHPSMERTYKIVHDRQLIFHDMAKYKGNEF